MSTTTTREQIDYNEVVGYRLENGVPVAVILDYTFAHGDGFHGATGTELWPVSADMVKEAKREKGEYLRELCDDAGIHGEARRQWVRMPMDEYLDMRFEEYDKLDVERINEALGIDWEANGWPVPVRWAVSGCGRIFPRAIEGLTYAGGRNTRRARNLVDAIVKAEAGNPS